MKYLGVVGVAAWFASTAHKIYESSNNSPKFQGDVLAAYWAYSNCVFN